MKPRKNGGRPGPSIRAMPEDFADYAARMPQSQLVLKYRTSTKIIYRWRQELEACGISAYLSKAKHDAQLLVKAKQRELRTEKGKGLCLHNEAVACNGPYNCDSCGWGRKFEKCGGIK